MSRVYFLLRQCIFCILYGMSRVSGGARTSRQPCCFQVTNFIRQVIRCEAAKGQSRSISISKSSGSLVPSVQAVRPATQYNFQRPKNYRQIESVECCKCFFCSQGKVLGIVWPLLRVAPAESRPAANTVWHTSSSENVYSDIFNSFV